MTYCLAISLNAGLVFASDSLTSAGVDNISTYSKMHTFVWEGERVLVLLSAGNLGTTQAVVKKLELDSKLQGEQPTLRTAAHMTEAAEYVGEVSAAIQRRQEGMTQQAVSFEASFILGGQIGAEPPELFLIYPQGNNIRVSPEHPFLQIGETKYGKPILDRIIQPSLSLEDAGRCALVSIDSTMRSNLSVGPPVELLLYHKDSLVQGRRYRFKLNTPYYASLRKHWTEGLKRVFDELPRFDFEKASSK